MKKQNDATYIDAFVLVVPKSKTAEYRKMAKEGAKLWMKYGALDYKECMGDDLNPDMQGFPFLPFPKMTKLKESETVWFSYIEYKSKKHREEVNKKVMKEMASQPGASDQMKKMPFDMKRMAFGGFKVIVNG
ncbi:DUF1428 domain-containing protein [bacterium]|nr:DUF1428 domain-containing protein [bacterium]